MVWVNGDKGEGGKAHRSCEWNVVDERGRKRRHPEHEDDGPGLARVFREVLDEAGRDVTDGSDESELRQTLHQNEQGTEEEERRPLHLHHEFFNVLNTADEQQRHGSDHRNPTEVEVNAGNRVQEEQQNNNLVPHHVHVWCVCVCVCALCVRAGWGGGDEKN